MSGHRRFILNRHKDPTGISGTGKIAEGCHFSTGKVVLSWLSMHQSVGIYDSVQEMMAIHGHGDNTQLIWKDD